MGVLSILYAHTSKRRYPHAHTSPSMVGWESGIKSSGGQYLSVPPVFMPEAIREDKASSVFARPKSHNIA